MHSHAVLQSAVQADRRWVRSAAAVCRSVPVPIPAPVPAFRHHLLCHQPFCKELLKASISVGAAGGGDGIGGRLRPSAQMRRPHRQKWITFTRDAS